MRRARSDAVIRRQQVLILRRIAKLSQAETAKRLKVSVRTVRRLEASFRDRDRSGEAS